MRYQIVEIIAYEGGIKPERITDDARLELDLGITGDDLWDILERMERDLNVELGNTDFSYFFYPECAGFIWELFHREQVISIKQHPITVSHLVNVAKSGVWFRPDKLN